MGFREVKLESQLLGATTEYHKQTSKILLKDSQNHYQIQTRGISVISNCHCNESHAIQKI